MSEAIMKGLAKASALLVCGTLVMSLFAAIAISGASGSHIGPFRRVDIRIAQVDIVHTTDLAVTGQVITISEPNRGFDLLALGTLGVLTTLTDRGVPVSDLPEGFITQFRLVLTDATITFDGTTFPLRIPSGVIKLNGVFVVPGDQDAVFHFDPEKQLIQTGRGIMLKPVIEFCTLPGPDLIVESFTHFPESPTTADLIAFTAVVKNIGSSWACSSTLDFKVGGETFGVDFAIPRLGPGETFTVHRQLVLDVAQNYQNTATADVNNEVPETDEGNNVTLDFYTVT